MRLRFASCELDLDRQELRRSGEPVHVEPQVFDLLAHLVRNRERVVSKDELIETIWGVRVISEAALSSRINAARRAVGDTGEEQALIRTVHKRGFRFVADVGEDAPALVVAEPESTPPAIEASPALGVLPPMGRTSIAVLPFANEGGSPDTEYFSYGLTEDIIRLLARYRWLTVLSRHSTFPFRGQDLPPVEIGKALGVRYLLQGAVRRRGDRVRITADLVSAESGMQLWSESFDHRLDDIFAIQDEMAEAIAAVIEPELATVERELAARKPPDNLDAWECYQRGLFHLWGFTGPGFAEAEASFRRAIEIEPGLARAHAALSYVNLQQAFAGEPEKRPARLVLALSAAQRSVALDERDCMCHCVLGRAHTTYRDYDPAVAALEHSIALNPSFAQAYFALGFTLTWCGRAEESIALSERAVALSPRDPHLWTFHTMRSAAHFMLGELEASAHFGRLALRHPNASHRPLATLVAALGLLGKTEEAEEAFTQLLRCKPDYSIAQARDDHFFCADEDYIARLAEGLRRAGVPEEG